MPRQKLATKIKRSHSVATRVTEKRFKDIKRAAKINEMTVGELIHQILAQIIPQIIEDHKYGISSEQEIFIEKESKK